MNLETAASSPGPAHHRRPLLIWLIILIVLCATAFSLFSLMMVRNILDESPDVNSTKRLFLESQTSLNYALAIATILGNLVGAVLLIFLRRAALYVFIGAAACSLINTTYNIFANDWIAAVGMSGLLIALVGWAINIAIILYVWSLARRGVLR